MKRRTITIITLVSTLAVATVAVAATTIRSNEDINTESNRESATPPLPANASHPATSTAVVGARAVEATTLNETVTVTGTTSAIREVTYASEVPGKIEAIGAKLGDKIHRGSVLARIDHDTLEAQKDQAQASYDLAKLTHERLSSLGESVVTRQQIDESRSAMSKAEAGLNIAANNASKGVVRADMRGVVTAKYKDKGEYVTPGAPIYHVVDYSTIVVEAQIAETLVPSIKKGSEVSVRIDALGESVTGQVKTILPVADSASKTFTVRVEIKNPDLKILVGMSATLNINIGTRENIILVPQDTVIESDEGRYVVVAVNDTAQKRPVTLGATQGAEVVITNGIAPGDAVIVLGHRSLEDGQPIHIAE